MTKGGHELFQEKKDSLMTLVEQLMTGYYEKKCNLNRSGHDKTSICKSSIANAFLDKVTTKNTMNGADLIITILIH